jgi:hypothetical protein
MNNLMNLPHDLMHSRGINLIRTASRAHNIYIDLIASLLSKGPLFVIAGNDWLPGLELARTIHRERSDAKRVLNGLYTIRTSNCYELFDSLASRRSNGEAILVLDFLHPFYDADIPMSVHFLKLRQCCRELQRLAFYRPVTVITTDTEGDHSDDFVSVLTSVADRTFSIGTEFDPVQQHILL